MKKLFKQLQHQLQKSNTPPKLQQTVITYVTERLKTESTHQHFKHFLIFAGLLPLRWKTQEPIYQKSGKNWNPQTWAKQLGKLLIQHGLEAWVRRNEMLHKNEMNQTTIHNVLNDKIHQLYSLQYELNAHDRDIFHVPKEQRLKMTERQKKHWIDTTTTTVYKCIEEHQQKMKQGQQDIRKYFTHKPKDNE